MSLADKACVPCRGGIPPLAWPRIQEMLYQLKAGWHLSPQGHLERFYQFPDFARALEFANKVGQSVAGAQHRHRGVPARLGAGSALGVHRLPDHRRRARWSVVESARSRRRLLS